MRAALFVALAALLRPAQPTPAAHRIAPHRLPERLMVASWYGPRHAGRLTASGEVFNPALLTFAHRSLPFGTPLRLSVAGRSCVARCNDRGPYVRGRDLDLSEAVARQLGMLTCGVAILRVEEVKP